LKEAVVDENISIGIITTPPAAAQEVADRLVDAGIKSILNFAPAVVNVPPDVQVRKVDLAIELQILSFHMQRMQAIATAREANRRLGGR
jgi:redox-sensing transcriptional repressor